VAIVVAIIAAPSVSSAPTASPGFADCFTNHAVVRPRSIVVACADGNFFLSGLRWSRWDSKAALGAGLGHQNLCTPSCADGHFRVYAVAVRLSRPVACKRDSRLFTRLSWRFTKTKPPGVARAGRARFPFPNSFHCP
jgi:hypothetical protein